MSDFSELIRLMFNPKVFAADALPEIILQGGPYNEQTDIVGAPLRDRIFRSEPRGLITVLTPPIVTHVYELVRTGPFPSRDDKGRYIYQYKGEEGPLS